MAKAAMFFVTFLTYKYGWGHTRGRGQFFIFFTLVWKCGWDNFFSSSTSNFFILWLIHFLHWYWIVLRRKINFRVGEFFTYYFWLRLSLEKEAFFLWIYIQNSKQFILVIYFNFFLSYDSNCFHIGIEAQFFPSYDLSQW